MTRLSRCSCVWDLLRTPFTLLLLDPSCPYPLHSLQEIS